ncbi:MAG: DNA helicase RecQ [Provencibacterium sp.]|jgi:ATP-dependent DNA helicase RecQ|nr:DNA helicase RecQ [Provencibacterium sp.]
MANAGDGKRQVLKQVFGYDCFREGQETLIDAILDNRDALGIMPTGAGKSICYQVPALMKDGIALVISPLISLMKDQVGALLQSGVRAAYLNSSLTPAQHHAALRNARAGIYRMIYVAPERLETPGFQAFAESAPISMVCIDEAHCVSQWGQDFRPSYLGIRPFIESLPRRPAVCAFTATATPEVRADIIDLLGLQNPETVFTGFDRKNLYFEVRQPADKLGTLFLLLREMPDRSGIIYCSTRKNVDTVWEALCGRGYPAARYHAGMPDRERQENQELFLRDERSVMVATNAFGMGIDKSNVSFVIHYNMPKNLENYYQEAGRAGRDGQPASCILLYSGQDVITNQFLIEHGAENEELDEETRLLVQKRDREKLKAMTFYCHTRECLRGYILRYFGENPPPYCGNCGSCNQHYEEADITVDAQKILSLVKRSGERFGVKTVVDTLRGSKSEKIRRLHLDNQSTYGLMADISETRLREMIQFLILEGFLKISEGEYPLLQWGPHASELLSGGRTLAMKLLKQEAPCPVKAARGPEEQAEGDPALFARLRALRKRIADSQAVPAYVVFTDAALQDMCARLPKTPAELLQVSGVGRVKLERYGQPFLEEINRYIQQAAGYPG